MFHSCRTCLRPQPTGRSNADVSVRQRQISRAAHRSDHDFEGTWWRCRGLELPFEHAPHSEIAARRQPYAWRRARYARSIQPRCRSRVFSRYIATRQNIAFSSGRFRTPDSALVYHPRRRSTRHPPSRHYSGRSARHVLEDRPRTPSTTFGPPSDGSPPTSPPPNTPPIPRRRHRPSRPPPHPTRDRWLPPEFQIVPRSAPATPTASSPSPSKPPPSSRSAPSPTSTTPSQPGSATPTPNSIPPSPPPTAGPPNSPATKSSVASSPSTWPAPAAPSKRRYPSRIRLTGLA